MTDDELRFADPATLTITQKVALGLLIEEEEREAADERKRIGTIRGLMMSGRLSVPEGEEIPPPVQRVAIRDIVVKAVHLNPTMYGQAKKIVLAAQSDPENFGDLPEALDRTRNTNGVYTEYQRRWSTIHNQPFRDRDTPKSAAGSSIKVMASKPTQEVFWNGLNTLSVIAETLDKLDVTEIELDERNKFSLELAEIVNTLRNVKIRLSMNRRLSDVNNH